METGFSHKNFKICLFDRHNPKRDTGQKSIHFRRAAGRSQRKDTSGTIRKIELSSDDPKSKRVGELNSLLWSEHHDLFFAGWDIHRRYTASPHRRLVEETVLRQTPICPKISR
jgi:hypothetical protein